MFRPPDVSGGVDVTMVWLGVDGGATRCRARVRDAHGRIFGEAEGAAANVHVDFDAALASIEATIAQALGIADVSRSDVRLGLGLAGVSAADQANRIEALFSGFAGVIVTNDAHTACLGAFGGADGGLVIAGTGSAGFASVEGRQTFVGGRGFLLGDDGSGARVGWAALRRTQRACDDLAAHTPFTLALATRFGGALGITRFGASANPAAFGALAPDVFAAARHDPAAREIAEEAGVEIGLLARAVRRLGAREVALVGGLAAALGPYLPGDARFTTPRHDATDGAILLAGGRLA